MDTTKMPSATKQSSSKTTPEPHQMQAASQRTFTREDKDGPAPVFVNNVEFSGVGMDVFMDAGTVTPEALNEAFQAKSGKGQPTVRFNVNFRCGMSLQTAVVMHQRLTAFIQASAAQLNAQPGLPMSGGAGITEPEAPAQKDLTKG